VLGGHHLVVGQHAVAALAPDDEPRLADPKALARVVTEMTDPDAEWENRFVQAGPGNILLLGFDNPDLKPLIGKTLAEVAAARGTSPAETAIDLVLEDDSRVDVSYFMMSEDNVRRKAAQPWISFGSDAAAPAAEGVFLQSNPHPRAYGTFATVLGDFVRERRIVPLREAIRRMTSFPAANNGITDRGRLAQGWFADGVVFDPAVIDDRATFEEPHQYAVGVQHVLVNGQPVIRDGEHTGALPGRVVRGPGWEGWSAVPGMAAL
jgi:N-acyl-D-amino-acid deacylase